MKTVCNDNSKVYYTGIYWNDLPQVLKYMSKNFTGDENKWWTTDFKERFAQKPFKHGLFINCGNGWAEREFIDRQIVDQVTAFDYSDSLLKIAQELKGKRSINYFQADVNKVNFKSNKFDLIVNIAALHHVQYIERLSKILATALKKDGILVGYDYIGPARNQYSLLQWLLIHKINHSLPVFLRQEPLLYPHLPTMLVNDPTEAIHSNLIIKSLSHYFSFIEKHDTGGGIAYPILTHNPKLNKIPYHKLEKYLDKILEFDSKYTNTKLIPPLFSYFIAKPNKNFLRNKKNISKYIIKEQRREAIAFYIGGVYSLTDYLKICKFNVTKKVFSIHGSLIKLLRQI